MDALDWIRRVINYGHRSHIRSSKGPMMDRHWVILDLFRGRSIDEMRLVMDRTWHSPGQISDLTEDQFKRFADAVQVHLNELDNKTKMKCSNLSPKSPLF